MGSTGLDLVALKKVVKIALKDERAKVTAKYSVASGLITGVTSVIGGVTLLPVGLSGLGFFGGAMISSLASAAAFKNKFVSLIDIIDSLPEKEQEEFYDHINQALGNINIGSLITTVALLSEISSADKNQICQLVQQKALQFLIEHNHSIHRHNNDNDEQ